MIIIIPADKLYKKRKKIVPYRNFAIINATTKPRMKDLPNVMSDIVKDDDGMKSFSGLDALAYQMPSAIFDDGIASSRKNAAVQSFFMSPDFISETINIIAYQIKHPDSNVYVAIEDQAYDEFVNEYVKRIDEILNMHGYENKIVFTWNSVAEMREYLTKQASDDVSEFNKNEWIDKDSYNNYDDDLYYNNLYVDTLEDDDYDAYLDNVGVLDILEGEPTNKEIRELFMRYARYTKKMIKALGKFIKRATERDVE
jgi:hypothetical protein